MKPGLKHTLILIITLLLIVPVMAGSSQAAQTATAETTLTATTGPDKAAAPAAMIIIGISLILVAGMIRKRLTASRTSNAATTGPKQPSGYVRPLLSRLNAIFFL